MCAARRPNAAAVVENANRITRGVMRRYTRTKAATQPDGDDLLESRWFGADGENLANLGHFRLGVPRRLGILESWQPPRF